MRPYRFILRRQLCSSSNVRSTLISLSDTNVDVGKAPRRLLVSGLNITVREGDRWAILGFNGCGKSVTSRLLGHRLNEKRPFAEQTNSDAISVEGAAFISFESHRQLLRDEAKQFNESRFTVTDKRATVSSYLFPDLYPKDPRYPDGYDGGYRPATTRLSPIPVPYDAGSDHPLLEELEAASCSGQAGWLLRELCLFDLRHQPVHGLSTGEGRKMMLVQCLLSPSRFLVLDEAFDGLDVASRSKLTEVLQTVLQTPEWSRSALALITHRKEDCEGLSPTHALLLGQGQDGTGYQEGKWADMESVVNAYFESQQATENASGWLNARRKRKRVSAADVYKNATEVSMDKGSGESSRNITTGETLVEFRNVSIRYPTSVVFDPPLDWVVREGDKWIVAGGNGSGKSTLLELITGENVLAYTQDVWLFGRKKGSGESIWDIKRQLGVLSTEFHMTYLDYADPSIRSFAHKPSRVTTWEVVCSGFFDSIGLYDVVTSSQEAIVREWVDFFAINDLVTFPPKKKAAGKQLDECPSFFELSQGQQKLVLLCRAMVKHPRLLLLDEPTHGLSGSNRDRLLNALMALADRPDVTVIYVTHRLDEIDAVAFGNVLCLGSRTHRNTLDEKSQTSISSSACHRI